MADSPVLSILPFSKGRSLLTSQHLASSGLFVGVQLAHPNGQQLLVGGCAQLAKLCWAALGQDAAGKEL